MSALLIPGAGLVDGTGTLLIPGAGLVDLGEPPPAVVKKLKLLINAAAVGATVDGVVWADQAGAIAGAEIGEFTSASIAAGTGADSGYGVLKVPVADFGGTALSVGDTPKVYVKNSTNFTPIWPGLVIEE